MKLSFFSNGRKHLSGSNPDGNHITSALARNAVGVLTPRAAGRRLLRPSTSLGLL